MELNPRESCQDKAGNVRAELNCCGLCGHIREPECWSSIVEYRMSSKHSSRVICLELLKDDNIDAKKVQTCMKNIPSRQPRNTVPMLTEKCKASIWNATCKNYEDENSKGFLTAKKEPEIKLKQYKSCNIQSFAWEKFDKNEEDKFVEYYLDTALQFNLVPDRCFQYPQNELPFIQNSGNENNSFSSIYTNCGSSKHVEIISPTNLPAQFSNECFNNAISGLKPSDSDIFVNTNYASLDYQYTCDCTNALQKEESGRCSSFSDNSIKRNTDLLCIDSNNTRSVQYDISGKLVKSKYSESVHSNCEMHSVFVAESDSANSECEFMGHSGFESELLDHEREPASSTESLFKSSKSSSLEDHLYSSQSDLKSQSESSHIIISEHMPSCCYNLKESVPVFSDGWSECQFSSQSEPSHSDTKEKDQSSTELISFPTVCTEESTIALSKGQNKLSFSAHLESCLSDKLRTYHGSQDLEQVWINSSRESNYSTQSGASLLESSGEALYVMPKMCAQFDNKLVSSSFRYYLLPDDQRQSEIRSIISSQLSSKSAKSHGIAFLNTTNANILSKSKEFFDVSAFKFGLEAGRYRMATKGLGVHEKPYLIRPLIIYKGTQSQVKNRHQVMQFYFTLMTALSIGESLKWLFQLQPRTIQALQGLQPILIYPFTNLNEFFSCKSRESPPGDEECMSVEWMRLQTFENYPITASGSPNRLVREGFYYTGQGTQTRCFSCGVTYGEWKYFDNPCEVHQRLSPNCPFLNGRQEGHINIPMSPDERGNVRRADRDSVPPPSLPVATLSTSGTGQNQGSRAVSRDATKTSRTTNEDDSVVPKSGPAVTTPSMLLHPVEESAQSETDNRPKFAEHVLLPSRIATFSHGWPPYLDQTPQQMAEAGFFFTDIITKSKETTVLSEFSVLNLESPKLPLVESSVYSNSVAQGARTVAGVMLTAHTNSSSNVSQDYTRCYQCGGGLRNWEPGDNPWIEHCRWYPTCPHVQKGKGQRFVNAVLKKQAELLSVQRAESRRKAQYGIISSDPLETLAAITLLEMGYPRDTVRNSILILRRQREHGAEITADEVLEFIWKEEDFERQRQEEEARLPRCPGEAQSPGVLPTLMQCLNLGGSPVVTQGDVQNSTAVTTTTSSVKNVAMTMTSVNTAISSTSGNSSITTTSTSASGSIHSTNESGQGQGQDEGQVHNAIDEDYETLEQENKRLKEQTTCKICMENPIRVIFLPCGHLVCCETCEPAFRKCPICRKLIQQTVKTFP